MRVEEVPTELDSAALIDGCTNGGIFFRIILPLVAPGLVAMFLFSLILGWNDFVFAANILRNTRLWTLPIALSAFKGMLRIDWSAIMAMSVLVSAPVMIMFFYLQRNVVTGITSGAIK